MAEEMWFILQMKTKVTFDTLINLVLRFTLVKLDNWVHLESIGWFLKYFLFLDDIFNSVMQAAPSQALDSQFTFIHVHVHYANWQIITTNGAVTSRPIAL